MFFYCVYHIHRKKTTPSAPLTTPLPANIFPNKVAPNIINKIPRNLPFCSLASSSTVLVTPFISKSDYSRDLTIFIISLSSSFENTNVAVLDP